ncbi:rhomboid family intramembrane serine protease [Haloarcula nitratireducens]|uniref:Rhomboid family intramembrane serine protease n=1 Tax=Haloarcula nitratireducens TaxID=2487749 RepID=A0AAW4P801_9EURY|nr:rhomboid family intramembrane serine protease [Halomicroarcula nitratireducens]MBX0294024.1 rhomboid family intramembrane serine protease [Halomicroarcula nitratireducens]
MMQSSLWGWAAAVPFRPLAVVVAVAVALVALRRLAGGRLLDPLRRRLLFGIPWGTLLTMAGVLAIYWFVQGAWWHARPLVTPFRTWSYFYPLGMLTGPFTHAGEGHVTGNLMATLVYGTVVEYVWGHYPRERGTQTFSSLATNPFARILAVPAAMAVVGVFTGVFAIGPVVGFSGVVFALAGFALVTRPFLFLGAFLANRIVDLVYTALRYPEPTVGGATRYITPWWADIAIQGHAIGLLGGVVVAGMLLRAREERPRPTGVFFATLVFAISNGLWAVYLPVGGGRFTLYRWLGTGLVFLLALLLAAGTRPLDGRFPRFEWHGPSIATLVIVIALGALCLASVPTNLVQIGPDEVPEDGVEVRDYVVTYDENVRDAYVGGIPTPFGIGEAQTNVSQSGVVVANADREVWIAAVPKGRLSLNERVPVIVGGVGWRETVYANRTGWSVLGNDTVYRVQLRREGGERRTAFTSPPSTADATIAERNVTVRPSDAGFQIAVSRGNQTIGRGPIPANMTASTIGGLTFDRNRTRLYAGENGTRVIVAEKRKPRN